MAVQVDHDLARAVLFEVAERIAQGHNVPVEWERIFEEISDECDRTNSRTHIAFLGTVLLARSVDIDVDTYARKVSAATPGAYDARSLAHKVLVPASQELDIHLGVTGREPLNNQPYFRISRATSDQMLPIVRSPETARRVLHILDLIDELDQEATRNALAAFVKVRRSRHPEYPAAATHAAGTEVSRLVNAAHRISNAGSGGRNAQALAAGILDAAFGGDYVVSCGRINDPDRRFVGDVCLAYCRRPDEANSQVAAFEVREKAVESSDIIAFQKRCAENNVPRAAVIAVGQTNLLPTSCIPYIWGEERGVTTVVYQSWEEFVRDVVFWSGRSPGAIVERAYDMVREYLIAIEASPESVDSWIRAFD